MVCVHEWLDISICKRTQGPEHSEKTICRPALEKGRDFEGTGLKGVDESDQRVREFGRTIARTQRK